MKVIGFYVLGLLFMQGASAFPGLFKPLPEPKPGGLLDVLKKPKVPGINIHLSKGEGGFGVGASIGSFGFGIGFGGHHVPPGTNVNLQPKDPPVPDEESYVPDEESYFPDKESYVPDKESYVPDAKPSYPDITPPEATSGKEKGEKGPTWEEYDKDDDPTRGSYGEEVDYPKHDSYEDPKDAQPSWEDIGETDQNDPDSKSEKFMDEDLINGGLIQPRLKKNRNRRFIESHVYHVPLLFRSNAKPFQVKVQSNHNSLVKGVSEK